jgi:hypothetical protein
MTAHPLIGTLRAWLTPPAFADEDKTQAAQLLHIMLWAMLPATLLGLIVATEAQEHGDLRVISTTVLVSAGLYGALLYLVRRGWVRGAS